MLNHKYEDQTAKRLRERGAELNAELDRLANEYSDGNDLSFTSFRRCIDEVRSLINKAFTGKE